MNQAKKLVKYLNEYSDQITRQYKTNNVISVISDKNKFILSSFFHQIK